jgi:DUF4097 and DUF4098 domain-containing protein YvlB
MSWLYSIVFAGLVLAGDSPVNTSRPEIAEPPTVVVERSFDETERFEQSYPINADGRVSVSNINGSITVEAWDRNEVRLEAVKRAENREALDAIDLKIDSESKSFRLVVDHGKARYGDRKVWNRSVAEVQIKLTVPRGAELNEIEAVNGSVTVSNFTNITRVSAVNGEVNATNLRGTASLETVNGSVKCDFDRLDPGSKISLSTVNGRVTLALPSDLNATLRADTMNGSIDNDFGLPVRKGEYVGRDLHGRVGSGGAEIKLESVNGPLTISRKADGRGTNPVTDLLPQSGSSTVSDQVNRSIDRSVRASHREAAAAMRQAQKEIEKIKPELEKMKIEGLDKIKIDIDEKAIEKSVETAMKAQAATLARMRSVNWLSGVPRVERVSKSFPVTGTPSVTINAKNCGISVRGWDKPEVKYVLTEVSRGAGSEPPKVLETAGPSAVTITVPTENASGAWLSANEYRLEVFVPRNADITVRSEQEIRVSGITGKIDITGADEPVDVRGVDGSMKIRAQDAQVRVVAFRGDLETDTTDGDVFLDGDFNSINSAAADGTIFLTLSSTANASLTSNTTVTSQHPAAVKESESKVRLGNGHALHKFRFVEGGVVLRSSDAVAVR